MNSKHLILFIAVFSSVLDVGKSSTKKQIHKECQDNAAKSDEWLLEHKGLTHVYVVKPKT
mgnify:CR=1 FL=1